MDSAVGAPGGRRHQSLVVPPTTDSTPAESQVVAMWFHSPQRTPIHVADWSRDTIRQQLDCGQLTLARDREVPAGISRRTTGPGGRNSHPRPTCRPVRPAVAVMTRRGQAHLPKLS